MKEINEIKKEVHELFGGEDVFINYCECGVERFREMVDKSTEDVETDLERFLEEDIPNFSVADISKLDKLHKFYITNEWFRIDRENY